LICVKSSGDKNRRWDGTHCDRVVEQGVISDNRRVWRDRMLFSQADGDMIFVLLNVCISIDPEGHCT